MLIITSASANLSFDKYLNKCLRKPGSALSSIDPSLDSDWQSFTSEFEAQLSTSLARRLSRKGWNENVGLAWWLLPSVLMSHPHIVFLLLHFQALAQLQLIDYIGEQTALLIKVSFPSPSPLPRYLLRLLTIYNQTQVRPHCASALIHPLISAAVLASDSTQLSQMVFRLCLSCRPATVIDVSAWVSTVNLYGPDNHTWQVAC